MINEEVRNIIEPELVEGEELLWADKPNRIIDYPYILLFVLSAMFLIFLANSDYNIAEPFRNFTTDKSPFILPSLLCVVFITAIRHWFLKTECYAITNDSVIIHSKIPSHHTQKISFDNITKVKPSRVFGADTLSLTIKGHEAYNSKAAVSGITVGFWNRTTIQLKKLTNSRIPLDLISYKAGHLP